MRTSMDKAGRIVVPKPLRDELRLVEGQALDIRSVDGRLEIVAEPTPMRLVRKGRGAAAVPERPLPVLTAEQVRQTLERVRR